MHSLPISAIVVARNAERTVAGCLEWVQRNGPAEIIVVDGVSSDRTADIAQLYTSKIYSDAGRGVSFAHQLGLAQATQPYIAYVDADIILPDAALATMLDEMKAGGFANVQAGLVPARSATYWERTQDWQVKVRQSRYPGGLSACVLDKRVALEIGFDPTIRIAGDDIDFLYRLKSAGYTAAISSVAVTHMHRLDFRGLVRQKFWYGRAKPALMRKYGPWKGDLWAPAVMVYWLAFCIIRGDFNLIPYSLVAGLADTAGMIKGLFEMTGNKAAAK